MKANRPKKPVEGILPRHSRNCSAKGWDLDSEKSPWASCTCAPAWQAWVYTPETGKIRKAFRNHELDEAKSWRRDALSAKEKKTLQAPSRQMIKEAGEKLIAGMEDGTILNRKGKPFKPSVIRSYKATLERRIYPEFGTTKVSELRRSHLKDWVKDMLLAGDDPSTIRNAIMPLRVIFREDDEEGEGLFYNPTRGLALPTVASKPRSFAPPAEAAQRIELLPLRDRALWATAIYAGLDNGELRALQVEDVDLDAGTITVNGSWDKIEGIQATKTDSRMHRVVPICRQLRDQLEPHLEKRASGHVFGPLDTFGRGLGPYDDFHVRKAANKVWKAAGLGHFTLHNGRHSFRSYLDAISEISEVRRNRYLGHSDGSMGARYTHTFDGQLAKDAEILDAFLEAEAGKVVRLHREAV